MKMLSGIKYRTLRGSACSILVFLLLQPTLALVDSVQGTRRQVNNQSLAQGYQYAVARLLGLLALQQQS